MKDKRKHRNEKRVQSERTEQTDNIKMQGRGNVMAQINVFILTPIYPNYGLAVALCAIALTRRK